MAVSKNHDISMMFAHGVFYDNTMIIMIMIIHYDNTTDS